MKTYASLSAGRWRQISILLTIIAVFLWAHSILSARLEIGYLGLIHSLPVTFFIALALLTIASAILWVSKEKHGKLLLLQLLILVIAIWLIPLVTGGSPLGQTSNILQYQRLDYSQLVWQGNKLYTQGREKMPYYIAISNRDRAWYGWFWGNYEFIGEVEQLMDNTVNCGLIYINPVLKLYESDD
jgi:hypothetical protein